MRPLLFGVLVFLLAPTAAHAQLSIYEDWSAGALRGDRWHGGEDNIVGGIGGLEVSRAITNNASFGRELAMRLRTQSSSLSDPRSGLNLMHASRVGASGTPGSVDAIDVAFRITASKVTPTRKTTKPGCPSGIGNNNPSEVDTIVLMTKFNDGSSSGPGDRTGDISVVLSSRYNTEFLHFDVHAFMFRCESPSCFAVSPVADSSTNLAATVTKNVPFRLGILDNFGESEFQLTFDGAVVGALDYSSLSVAPAAVYDAAFGVRVDTGDCWVGSPTPDMVADITVKVGDVQTNPGAVIP
jgi:hypothetical protein